MNYQRVIEWLGSLTLSPIGQWVAIRQSLFNQRCATNTQDPGGACPAGFSRAELYKQVNEVLPLY